MNDEPIFIDFNSADEDGSPWLSKPFRSAVSLEEIAFFPENGSLIWVTDGEIELKGLLEYRSDRWVVVQSEAQKQVPKDAPYSSDNVKF